MIRSLCEQPSPKNAVPGCAHGEMDLSQLAEMLTALGCPQEKSLEMAAQLDKRAKQLAQMKDTSYDDALAHLIGLMRQGWAAKDKGLS